MKAQTPIQPRTSSFRGMHVQYMSGEPGMPVILFLHDSLGCVALWRDFPEKLGAATGCGILLYDRTGYGLSEPMPTHIRQRSYLEQEAGILDELLDAFAIKEAILFGHSDGGSIALITAAKYPRRIKGVLCEAAHIFVEEITLNGIRAAVEAFRTTSLPQRLQKYHGTKTETLFKAWTETWLRADYRDWNIEHFLPHISCPLLFIQGSDDEYGSMAQVVRTVSGTGGRAEKCIIAGTGHTPHKEAPATTLEAASDFIQGIISSGG